MVHCHHDMPQSPAKMVGQSKKSRLGTARIERRKDVQEQRRLFGHDSAKGDSALATMGFRFALKFSNATACGAATGAWPQTGPLQVARRAWSL